MGTYRIKVRDKRLEAIVTAPSLAEASSYYANQHPDAEPTHIIESADLAKVLNALYPQDWQRQLNALLRAVWEEHSDELEARLVRHAVAEELGDLVRELVEAKED